VNLLTGRTCTDPWHGDAPLCRAQYPQSWTGSHLYGTRIVRCSLPAGHTGNHEEVETCSSWRDPRPVPSTSTAVRFDTQPADQPLIEQLGHLDVLRLEPGDTLVFTVNAGQRLPQYNAELISTQLRQRFPDHVILFVEGGTLGVIRTTDQPSTVDRPDDPGQPSTVDSEGR
jgi:hypothetical protein